MRFKNLGKISLLVVSLTTVLMSIGCTYADPSSLKVETTKGQIKAVHHPGEWVFCNMPGCNLYDVDLKPWTDDIEVHTATKDNAPLKLKIRVIGQINDNYDGIYNYLTKFGLDVDERHKRRWAIESGAVQGIVRDAVVQHDAYSVFAEQGAMQTYMKTHLETVFGSQLFAKLVDVQIIDRPDFDNDEIELAAGRVVAAKKQKEAEDALKAAASVKIERMNIENAQWVSSPQAYELKKLEWQKYIAEAWAQNHAPIVFGGSNLQVQIPAK